VAFVASVLLLAVLLDINSLALFAVITAAGLSMFAMFVPIAPPALVLLPTAGAATAFLWLDGGASDANAYFYDDWANTGAKLWPVPQSEQLAIVAGHLFSLGLVVAVVYAIMRGQSASRRNWTTSAGVGAIICLALVLWASQPAIWQSAFTSATTANRGPNHSEGVVSRITRASGQAKQRSTLGGFDDLDAGSLQSRCFQYRPTPSVMDRPNCIDTWVESHSSITPVCVGPVVAGFY
jgi:hypothetical protein